MSGAFSVLVFEPNAHLRWIIRSMMSDVGIGRIMPAGSLSEAYEIMRTREPGAMILDLDREHDERIQAMIRHVRTSAMGLAAMVPVIVTTSMPTRGLIVSALKAGANDVVVKPYSIRTLVERLDSHRQRPQPFVRQPGFFGPLPRVDAIARMLRIDPANIAGPPQTEPVVTKPLTLEAFDAIYI